MNIIYSIERCTTQAYVRHEAVLFFILSQPVPVFPFGKFL